ncbi:MAG: hypothetical protein HQL16_03920 [Candidatus Omnitrophica bacterium]|nr:hypothetical protein [Candidatus Omnitrophota bacterium]
MISTSLAASDNEATPDSPQDNSSIENDIKDLSAQIITRKQQLKKPQGQRNSSAHLSGEITNETASRLSGDKKLTSIRNEMLLGVTGAISNDISFKVSGRAYYDTVYNWTHNFNPEVKKDQQKELELRDTYLDYSNGPWDFRLGKQQIVWGDAVALFFADVVNARDMREFILPDLNMIRIPEWGSLVEYSAEPFHAEMLWIPAPEFDKFAKPGAPFAFPYPVPSLQTPLTTRDPEKPANNLQNGKYGLRLSYKTDGWDFSSFALHTWTDTPAYFRTIDSGVFDFTPRYERTNFYGATFSKEVNDIVLKGEFAYNQDNRFSTLDPADTDGVAKRDAINYLIGADYTFNKTIDTTLQYMQKIVLNPPDFLAGERPNDESVALRVKTSYVDGRVAPECTVITSLMEPDLLYRPLVNLRIKDNWQWRLGADIFRGHSDGLFGEFRKESRVYSHLTYSF